MALVEAECVADYRYKNMLLDERDFVNDFATRRRAAQCQTRGSALPRASRHITTSVPQGPWLSKNAIPVPLPTFFAR